MIPQKAGCKGPDMEIEHCLLAHLGVAEGALAAVGALAGGQEPCEGGQVVAALGLGAGCWARRQVAREALVHTVHRHTPCQQLTPADTPHTLSIKIDLHKNEIHFCLLRKSGGMSGAARQIMQCAKRQRAKP